MDKPNVRFQRANYVVTDIERALEFYVGVLGLTLDFVKESEKTSYSYPVFEIPKAADIQFTVLSAPNQPRVMALTEIKNINLEIVAPPRRNAIVLETPDLESVATRAQEAGFLVYQPVEFETIDGRRGWELGIVDADNNLTVVYSLNTL